MDLHVGGDPGSRRPGRGEAKALRRVTGVSGGAPADLPHEGACIDGCPSLE